MTATPPRWSEQHLRGAGQCVPAVVLAGVCQLALLRSAQDEYGVAIFWQHDLAPLEEFVRRAR